MQSASDSPEISREDEALSDVFVGEGRCSDSKKSNSYFSDHFNNIKI